MILSQPDLREAVAKGEIRFDPPLEENQWHEASVDLRLGFKFTKLAAKRGIKVSLAFGLSAIADAGLWKEKILKREDELGKQETYSIEPGEFILAQTYERIWVPRHLIAAIEGRSSYARGGLSMHLTAPWLQPGWNGLCTLEIFNSGPLTVELTPTVDRPCQLTFFRLSSEVPEDTAYGTRSSDSFQDQTSTIPTGRK
jgi:dCTP deaminase